jgi:hypothetical protein
MDFLWLAMKMWAVLGKAEIGFGCDFLFTLIWYPLTLYVLGDVFPGTGLWQGMDMVTQQLTSIGYGGANVRGNDQKLFHAINGMASQLGPSKVYPWLIDFFVGSIVAGSEFIQDDIQEATKKGDTLGAEATKDLRDRWADDDIGKNLGEEQKAKWKQLVKGAVLLISGALTFILLYNPKTGKNGGLEAFYATLISATTVGYGDISPSSEWAKVLSAFVLPVLTGVFADFFGTDVRGSTGKTFSGSELFRLSCPDLDEWKNNMLKQLEVKTPTK